MTSSARPDLPQLRRELLSWFDRAGRTLPWREGQEGRRDPYRVWVAEILLQQTQVSRGLLYYERFLAAFPNVQALAEAPQVDVLKAWEGCGYYARARNLQKGAQHVAGQGFPTTYQGWLEVPGVGPYTAAAIASLAFAEARAVNDGNVRRVLSRLYAEPNPSEAWVSERAAELLDPLRPGAWNEAVMDLGATICTPKAPQCVSCPVSRHCLVFAGGNPAAYPAPKVRAAVRNVQMVAVLVGDAQHAALERREGKLLGGLMGLPSLELSPGEMVTDALQRLCQRLHVQPGELLGQVSHTMTHRRITLHVYRAAPLAGNELPLLNVERSALSRLDQKALALLAARQVSLFGQ